MALTMSQGRFLRAAALGSKRVWMCVASIRPRLADLRQFSTRDLDNIANRINTRSRRVLDWATSAELFWPRVRAQYVV